MLCSLTLVHTRKVIRVHQWNLALFGTVARHDVSNLKVVIIVEMSTKIGFDLASKTSNICELGRVLPLFEHKPLGPINLMEYFTFLALSLSYGIFDVAIGNLLLHILINTRRTRVNVCVHV